MFGAEYGKAGGARLIIIDIDEASQPYNSATHAASLKIQGENNGMTFKPGQSGNPAGKPPGTRNRVTRAVEELLDGEAEALTRKAVEMAKAGDIQAMRICLDRIAPARKDRYVPIDLPPLDSADDAVKASAVIVAALSAGDLTPSEASELGKLVGNFVTALTAADFEKRLRQIEAAQAGA